jgi:hypothetical protein
MLSGPVVAPARGPVAQPAHQPTYGEVLAGYYDESLRSAAG